MKKPTHTKTGLRIAALLALLLFVANPELRALLLLIDYAGIELIVLLLALQFSDLWRHVHHGVILPSYVFLCRLSVLPCWMPSWADLRRQPSLILYAFPFDAAIVLACAALLVFLLVTGAPLRFHWLR